MKRLKGKAYELGSANSTLFGAQIREKILCGNFRRERVNWFREVANRRGCTVPERPFSTAYIHTLLIPSYSVSGIAGYLKRKSTVGIAGRFGKVRKIAGEDFWARGFPWARQE